MQRFYNLAKAIAKRIEKEKEFYRGEEQATAWERLKRTFVSTQILAFLDPKKTFILDTEASGIGVWAVTYQERDGRERVIVCEPDVNKRRGEILCHSPVVAYSCAFNEAVQTPPAWAEILTGWTVGLYEG